MICMKSSYNAFHIIQYMKFTALMKKVFLDVKEIAHIDNKKYNNKIAKISIGEHKNDIKVKIKNQLKGTLDKSFVRKGLKRQKSY